MESLLLLLLLQIKHYYADFVIQTYAQTVKKGVYRDWCGISHSLDHAWTSMIVLLIFNVFVPVNPLLILILPLIEGVIHYHIDWIKVRYGTKDMHRGLFWNQFGLDQLAHQLTYLGLALILV